MAREKLRQSRAMLDQGRFDDASRLAGEANAWPVKYGPNEDTPTRLLDEINRSKKDGKFLLQAARKALVNNELDRAENLAHAAQEAQPRWSVSLFGDSPAKVLADVKAARGPMPRAGTAADAVQRPQAGSRQEPSGGSAVATKREAARKLLRDGRAALAEGDVAKAREMQQKAAELKADLGWWEDNPDKLMADIARAPGKQSQGPGGSGVVQAGMQQFAPGSPLTQGPAFAGKDARAILQQGRELLKEGKLEDAYKAAQAARNVPKTSWGLFEDNPDKLIQDVERMRLQRDQDDAVKCLADGRKMLASGNLDEASKLAYKAQRLHGPYTIWDLGDRPQRLLADVQTARDKQRKGTLPPPVPGVTAKTNDVPKTPPALAGDGGRPPFIDPRVTQAAATQPGPVAPPGVPPMPGVPSGPMRGPNAAAGMGEARKQQAQALLTEARQFQARGQLVEARQKAIEAQSLAVTFGPTEDSPEQAVLQLSSLCYKRVDGLMQQAADFLTVSADADRFRKAEDNLLQARQLALSFGLDVQPMDSRLAQLRQMQAAGGNPSGFVRVGGAATQPVAGAPGAPAAGNPGAQMLEQARQNLRAGKTVEARKMAEQVFAGQYGLQKEAEALLRTVDAEEFGQQRLANQKTFDAGVRALNRRDYAQAVAIFRGVNVRMLDRNQQVYLSDVLSRPELRNFTGQPAGVATVSDQQPGALPQAAQAAPTDVPPPVAPGQDLIKSAQAMQDIKFQQLRQQGLEVQREAADRFKAGDTDRALEILNNYVADLQSIQLTDDRVSLLKRPIDARLLQFSELKKQRDYEAGVLNEHKAGHELQGKLALMEANKQKQVTELMAKNKASYEAGKYTEAESYASAALELDPDNAAAAAAIKIARMQDRTVKVKKLKDSHESMFLNSMDDTDDEEGPTSVRDPLKLDGDATKRAAKRDLAGYSKGISLRTKSEKEREIEHKLSTPVRLNFNDTPLEQVLEDLGSWHGINIVPDTRALESEGVSLKQPIKLCLENVSLKSALNLILKKAGLTYVIADEVVQVTTERHASGKLVTVTYNVADLVIPVENFYGPAAHSLDARLERMAGGQTGPQPQQQGPTPFRSPLGLQGGQQVASWSSSGGPGQFATEPRPTVGSSAGVNRPTQTMEESLIKLITSTVAPQSWDSMGGPGTIEYFPLTMALVVNQATDIQEQVLELLSALRRLQDQEVAIEVRFITIAESFFERIGLDFNVNIKTDHETLQYEPQLVTNQFKPVGFINDFSPTRFISGLTPAGTFTSDLDIPIQQGSFGLAIPEFGGFPTGAIANGGIQLGLAFLSDIQVFLFLEAAQGDRRTNVMQAPKITMFNGQTSSINITDQQFFVTNITGIQNGGQFIFLPQNQPIPTGGTSLTVQAVISADRRYVRMSIQPNLTNLASATVPLFPIVLSAQPFFEGVGNVGNPVLLTQFVQQPTFTSIQVQTTVTVPDGGTVLMGGFKRLSEGRNEFGPPILSKIPYVNRLFRNVGFGREAESLMIMVTPRIIINEEEEFRQTGVGLPPP